MRPKGGPQDRTKQTPHHPPGGIPHWPALKGGGAWRVDRCGQQPHSSAHSAAARELRGPSSVAVGSGGAGAVWPAIESFVRYDNARCMLYLTVRGGDGRGGVWRRRCAGLGAIIASEDPLAAAAAVPARL